jgi:tetratricopeptide (TPR) repeat protein
LGEKAQALAYYEQALPLSRQVGDRWGESITCYNMAMVYRDLEDLAAAEQLLLRTVELDEASGRPALASDRAMLEQVRQERRAG